MISMKKTSIELPEKLYKKVKLFAVYNDTKIKDVIVQALEDYLDKRGYKL